MPRNGRSGTLSIIQAVAIDDRRMGAAELRVLVALGTYADPEGWCWPKQKQLAQRIGISRQAVSKSLLLLQEHGYIEIHHQHDEATGSQISSRYRIVMDFVLGAENRRTPQPDVAGGVKLTLRPPQPDVDAPATPEVAPIERPIRTTHKERPKKIERSSERSPKASSAQKSVIDAITAGGGEVDFGPRDGKAVKDCAADPQLIADAYLAAWRGEWGDGWLRENLSVRLVVERLGGYRAWLSDQRPAAMPQPTNARITPATDADRAIWARASADIATMNNAANYESFIAPLEVAGRGPDGGLRLLTNPLNGTALARFRGQIVRALLDAGDTAPAAVGFVARKQENHTDGD